MRVLTVHSCVCWSSPNALEKTSPPIGLPAGREIRIQFQEHTEARRNIAEHKIPRAPRAKQGKKHAALTVPVRAVRVELAALVALRDVDLREVPDARHLYVVGRLHKVRARDRAVRDDARAVPGLRAPRDLDALRVPDHRVRARLRRREDAPVLDRVHYGREGTARVRR